LNSWKTCVLTKQFWLDLFRLNGDPIDNTYAQLKESIHFSIKEGEGFYLSLTPDLSDISLLLVHPNYPNQIELAYLSEAYWHHVLFRWSELEKISDFLAKQSSDIPPAIPFLLLSLFTPVTIQDDVNNIQSKVREAFKSLHLLTEDEIEKVLPFYGVSKGIEWVFDPEYGWVVIGEQAYSFRVAGEKNFPFQIFNRILKDIMDCVSGAGSRAKK
jgi:hypothetical protein